MKLILNRHILENSESLKITLIIKYINAFTSCFYHSVKYIL